MAMRLSFVWFMGLLGLIEEVEKSEVLMSLITPEDDVHE